MILCGEAMYGYVIHLVFREERRGRKERTGTEERWEAVAGRVRAT